MMKKTFKLSLVCASIFALTACGSDDTDTTHLEEQIQTLEAQNDKLTKEKASVQSESDQYRNQAAELTATNNQLQEKAVGYISNFQEQCAEVGITFDYENPNPENPYINNGKTPELLMARSYSIVNSMPNQPNNHEGRDNSTCTNCHSEQVPDKHFGENCTSCHNFAEPEPTDPVTPTEPGAPGNPTHPADGNWDGLTGASAPSTFYYNTDGASFVNAEYLNTRLGKQNTFYEWKESSDGTSDVKSACGLANREHITTMFPNDGKPYELAEYKNFKGAATFITQRKENGESIASAATFGPGMHKGEDGEFYVTMLIGKNNTCKNLVNNSKGEIHYYEFDTRSNVKLGSPELGARNAGARIQVSTDYAQSQLNSFDWSTPVYGANGEAFDPTAVDWNTVGACSLTLKVEVIYPLG
ncbi:hypothetical protein L1D44_15110 [Shewanella sp. Isolate13]|uniref:cell division protein ZapB n=1 Tax=Shewanella sp. Isolate13 TaxID=2908531 RepID=UPI001EFDE9FE|nr:cell division protein ZapB [Shewanella sp. Isolate13]MCG9731126.1 hypothetical protein [Shewanella sp. Isolate13]